MHTIATLADLRIEISRLLSVLRNATDDTYRARDAAGNILPLDIADIVTFDRARGDATPAIECRDGVFNFVVSERGAEHARLAGGADAVLRELFTGVAFSLAANREARSRVEGQDPRRRIFAEQLRLLRLLDSAWAEACRHAQAGRLARHPFVDRVGEAG